MSANKIDVWLAAVADSSDDAIVTKTLDGVIQSWNRGAERLFECSAAEAVGQNIFLIVPSDRIAEEHDVLARLRRGERVDHFDTIRQAKDGRRIPISLTVSPVRDHRGVLIGASKVARDIRTRLQSDEIRGRLAAIVQSSDDAIVAKTLDGMITAWNEAAERLFGYAAAEAVGQSIFLIVPQDRRAEEEDVLSRLRRGERIDHFETIRQSKDGRRLPMSLSVSPIRDDQGRIIGASKVARDISDRVERERMQLLTRLVVAQEDERARMARELHDELGQQMTALRLTLETLRAATLDRHDLRAQIDMLQEMARQLDADVAFRVRGLRSAILETRGLAAALREYVGNWSQHSHVPLRLHANVPGDDRLPPEVGEHHLSHRTGGPQQRAQARARRACRRGARAPCRSRVPDHRRRRRGIRHSEDGGRHGRRRRRPGGHAGTGRADRRRSPDRIHGRPRHDGLRPRGARGRGADSLMARRLRVLLADDHAIVRQGLKLLIDAQPDMTVVGEAADGDTALAQAQALQPDIVVMDISMPGTNGLTATRALKEWQPALVTLVLTRHEEDRYLQEMLRAGASGYVLKQSPPPQLLQAIRAVAAGGIYLDPAVTARVADGLLDGRPDGSAPAAAISDRESEVLRLVAVGHSNKEIADRLNISVKTVEVHKANAMRKLGLTGRVDVIRYGVLRGWLYDT